MESTMPKLGEEQIPPNHRIMAQGGEEMQHCKAVRQNGCSEHLGYSNFCLSFRVGTKKGHLLPGWWVWLGMLSFRERATNVWPVGAGGTSAQPPELLLVMLAILGLPLKPILQCSKGWRVYFLQIPLGRWTGCHGSCDLLSFTPI